MERLAGPEKHNIFILQLLFICSDASQLGAVHRIRVPRQFFYDHSCKCKVCALNRSLTVINYTNHMRGGPEVGGSVANL